MYAKRAIPDYYSISGLYECKGRYVPYVWVWTVNSDWVSHKRLQFETTYTIHVFAITLIQLLVEQGPIFNSVEYTFATFLLCVIYVLQSVLQYKTISQNKW